MWGGEERGKEGPGAPKKNNQRKGGPEEILGVRVVETSIQPDGARGEKSVSGAQKMQGKAGRGGGEEGRKDKTAAPAPAPHWPP